MSEEKKYRRKNIAIECIQFKEGVATNKLAVFVDKHLGITVDIYYHCATGPINGAVIIFPAVVGYGVSKEAKDIIFGDWIVIENGKLKIVDEEIFNEKYEIVTVD